MAAALTAPARALKALLADLPITEQQQQEAVRPPLLLGLPWW